MSTVDGKSIPEGVVVSIICNIDGVGMTQLAFEIAKNFEAVKFQNNAYKVSKVFLCWLTKFLTKILLLSKSPKISSLRKKALKLTKFLQVVD